MEESNIEPPNNTSNYPPRPPSFLSLPEDIVLSCLARISNSYYPKLSLVSKIFRSFVLSNCLYQVRSLLNTQEECLYLGLRSPANRYVIWFRLWTKSDDQTLNHYCTIQDKSRNSLVPLPSSYTPFPPYLPCEKVGSKLYMIGGQDYRSSSMRVYNELTGMWSNAPRMLVARRDPLICVMDEKIYVLGGGRSDETTYWGEVFDPKSQTWEPLPDPCPEVRFSLNKKLILSPGKIYVTIKKKNVESKKKKKKNVESKNKKRQFVYLLKEKKWEVVEDHLRVMECCVIENVAYSYVHKKFWWYETTSSDEERLVNGLTGLDAYVINDTEIGTYGGKLVIFWDSPASSPLDETKEIWCAVILLDKSISGEVWGHIESVGFVLRVPVSYTLWRCVTLLR